MRALVISGIVMAVSAIVIAIAYWGFGMTPVDLLELAFDIVTGNPNYCKPLPVK